MTKASVPALHIALLFVVIARGKYRPVIPQWPEMYEIIGTEMSNIIAGTKTVDEGLAYAQQHLESDIVW